MSGLVEVFSVAYQGGGGASPSGTIAVYDGNRGQIIYRRDPSEEERLSVPTSGAKQDGTNAVQLRLTGPYGGISVDGCVAIVIHLRHGCQEGASSYVAEMLIDIYDESTQYGVANTKKVKTCSCPHSPLVEVTYMCVKLLRPDYPADPGTEGGFVTRRPRRPPLDPSSGFPPASARELCTMVDAMVPAPAQASRLEGDAPAGTLIATSLEGELTHVLFRNSIQEVELSVSLIQGVLLVRVFFTRLDVKLELTSKLERIYTLIKLLGMGLAAWYFFPGRRL